MKLRFSQLPGRHERHLQRKYNNPLFPESEALTQQTLTEAQRLDHEELVTYIEDLRALISEAVAIGQHEQSDVILELKEKLDKCYETACRLADDQSANKEAIQKLVVVIMRAVWEGAGNDILARQELEQEERARKLHYQLLEYPLVADLLDPDSTIKKEELLPTLLSADKMEFEAAVNLFNSQQIIALCQQGESLLTGLGEHEGLQIVRERMIDLQALAGALDNA